MATYTQSERPLEITTPLGKDVLLLTGFKGHETISEMFCFELDMIAQADKPIKFEKILGQAVTIRLDLTNGDKRYFNGIVNEFRQAGRNDTGFGKFRATIVPKLWTLSRKVRSRTFQHLSIPEILKLVLVGFDVSFRLIGTYPPRDYCVQYRESDFAFASRLMEEEGISYLFEHDDGMHTMIVTDKLNLMVDGQSTVIYDDDEGSVATDMRITEWEKAQRLGSGEFTFWDHCFELPGNHLEAKKKLTETIKAGTVEHKLRVGVNDEWEVYDYPGPYARRFDGIDSSGSPDPQGIHHIFEDRARAIRIRMQQDETASIDIHGESYCGNFSAGHKFELKRHFDADGEYLLTKVEHEARLEDHQTGEVAAFQYANRFRCVASMVHFRPQPVTPKPIIPGIQTATVVGPPGEEIFVDKYGRVKVQFHWDREGKMDASSSCWLRVSQFWAGKQWGAFFWPRIGNEVVVLFEDGDPDQPIVIGSVYNKENMPWFDLPLCKDFGGFKSVSLRGSAHEHFNGIILVDRKGQEHLAMHSERHMIVNAEFDQTVHTGRHHGQRVPGHRTVTVGGLPGSGSGGGPDRDLWPNPPVQSILGLNTAVVYGTNVQTATPIAFQLALGSNLQMCLNPSALTNLLGDCPMPPLEPALAQVVGAGIGGNMQFTLGTSANFVIGQSYDINIGPRRIVVDVHDQAVVNIPMKVAAWFLISLALVFEIAYAIIGIKGVTESGDDARAILTCLYLPATQALMAGMMANVELNNIGNSICKTGYNGAYLTDDLSQWAYKKIRASDDFVNASETGVAIFSVTLVVIALATPPILIAIGEHQLDVGH